MTAYCPDCLNEIPVRKPGKDGRCDWCRSQVGHTRHYRTRYADNFERDRDTRGAAE